MIAATTWVSEMILAAAWSMGDYFRYTEDHGDGEHDPLTRHGRLAAKGRAKAERTDSIIGRTDYYFDSIDHNIDEPCGKCEEQMHEEQRFHWYP